MAKAWTQEEQWRRTKRSSYGTNTSPQESHPKTSSSSHGKKHKQNCLQSESRKSSPCTEKAHTRIWWQKPEHKRSDGGEGSGRLEEGILALSPPSRVYCENAFGTRLMLMVQGGKSHDRGWEWVHVVCKTSNWCNGIARPTDGVARAIVQSAQLPKSHHDTC